LGKLKRDENELLDSVEAGEWQSLSDREKELKRYREYATATFKKDRRINIRISSSGPQPARARLVSVKLQSFGNLTGRKGL